MIVPSHATGRLKDTLQRGGLYYSGLYVARGVVDRLRDRMDCALAAVERRKRLIEPWTISARRFTAIDNKALWNTYDWSQRGEEWTQSAEWKQRIVRELLQPHVPERGVVVEIGPGGGRWTEILQQRARQLFVVDVAERALSVCRERFAACSNMHYLLSDGGSLDVPNASVDAIWSYDVFVHINPPDTRSYLREFRRVLRAGGRAVIHHPGRGSANGQRPGWRSDTTDEMIAAFCRETGLKVIFQTSEIVNPGDVLSVLENPA